MLRRAAFYHASSGLSKNRVVERCLSLIWSAAARYSATPLSFPIDSITSQSGVAEYLAAALQIKTSPTAPVTRPFRFSNTFSDNRALVFPRAPDRQQPARRQSTSTEGHPPTPQGCNLHHRRLAGQCAPLLRPRPAEALAQAWPSVRFHPAGARLPNAPARRAR